MTQTNQFPVYSISINGLLSWQLHALNNEGNEGNQSLTRRYYIMTKNDPEPQYVNGISGDMMKHIQSEHLHRVAIENNLALSEGCKKADPDRIGYDIDKETKDKPFFSDKEGDLTKSVLYTYLQPNGAKRNTNLPHPDRFEGVITVSTKRCPAPMISPLQIDTYQRQITSLAQTFNRINGEGTIIEYPFEDFAQFAEQIEKLIQQAQPWETTNGEGNQ